MNTISLEQVAGNDPGLKAALTDAHLPTDDIEDDGRTFFKVIAADGRIVGFSGVELCGVDYLLRSVVVLSEHRGQSLGRAVVEQTLARLDRGDVFLATTSAAPFFARIGFSEVPRDSVPASVLATRQLSSLCPSSATIMRLIRPPT